MTPSPSRRASPCTATGSFWPCWNDWPWSRPSTKRSPPPWRRCGPRATASSFPKPRSWSWSSRRSSSRRRYGVRLRAKAPSIHMIRADIQAEVSPIVGSEKQSEDMLGFLLEEFEGAPEKIWQSNIFGRVVPRADQRGPGNKAQAHAGGRPRENAADPGAHPQRRLRRADLHHSVTDGAIFCR